MTLDTKALEAAAEALYLMEHPVPTWGWADLSVSDHQVYLRRAQRVIDPYLATSSQSLPDELKAIAERAKVRRSISSWDDLAATLKQTEADRKALLPHIQDIRRDTAREIVEAIEQRVKAIEISHTVVGISKDTRDIIGLVVHELNERAASIRTAYGVEG